MKAGVGTVRPSLPARLRPGWIAGPLLLAVTLGLGLGFGVHRLTADTAKPPTIASTRFGMHGEAAWPEGARTQLAPVWAAYHIYVSPHPVGGDIVHTEALYLVDRRSYMRSGYLYPFLSAYVSGDLRTLAGGRGA